MNRVREEVRHRFLEPPTSTSRDPKHLVHKAGAVLTALGGVALIVAAGTLLAGLPDRALEAAGAGLLKVAIGGVLVWVAPDRPPSGT